MYCTDSKCLKYDETEKKPTWKDFILRFNVSLHFLVIKPNRCTNLSNLFWNETLHVSDSFSIHRQEFFTVHTAMVYVILVCWQLASRIRMDLQGVFHCTHSNGICHTCLTIACKQDQEGSPRSFILILLESCQQTCMVYTTAMCTVKKSWWWTEELSETCRVSFQNKFEKLVHLVGFIRICQDARPHERTKKGFLTLVSFES